MTFTANNYIDESCRIPIASLPAPLKKGHDLALKAFDKDAMAYKSNDIVKTSMDHYLVAINEFMAKEQPIKSAPRKKKEKPVLDTSPKNVERIPTELRFIKRFVNLLGKEKSRRSILSFLTSLQKAMLEKRIRKSSSFAKEILEIQDHLIKAANSTKDPVLIELNKKSVTHYKELADMRSVRRSIALLKRYLSIHGKEDVKDKAVRLKAAMQRSVTSGQVKKTDPYAEQLNQAYRSLVSYLNDKSKAPKIEQGHLNGIMEAFGEKARQHKTGRKQILSSQDLLRMDFETIGLKGKFRKLIGDPSVGFTAMVFGQPKSGKSTLMLEFAQELAMNHGKVLYAAIEEGYGYTLKEKIQRVGATSSRLHFAEKLPSNLNAYDFVFVDSVSRAGMELEDMIKLKNRYPRTGFIFIFHSTKDGKFRGGNELAHEVDAIIEVEKGLAKGKGRFGHGELAVRLM